MTRNVRVIDVFVGSPGDVAAERDQLEREIAELNRSWSVHGFELRLFRWETNAVPGFGTDPQDVINRQLPEDADVFIGILWARLGTPTPRAPSGTIEEFDRALARWREEPSSIKILLYFKTADFPNDADLEQIKGVRAFRAQVPALGGLYSEFRTAEQFGSLVRKHLLDLLLAAQMSARTAVPVPDPENVELAETEPALLDTLELFLRGAGELESITEAVADDMNTLGQRMERQNERLLKLGPPADAAAVAAARKEIDSVASHVDVFSESLERRTPELDRVLSAMLTGVDTMLSLAPDFGPAAVTDILKARPTIHDLDRSIEGAVNQIASFAQTVAGFPSVTTRLNRAKLRCSDALQRLELTLRAARGQAAAIERVFERLASQDAPANPTLGSAPPSSAAPPDTTA